VHSFTQSGLGPFFMGFLLVILAVSLALLLWRLPLLKSRNELESVFSREAAFLLNNLVLVGIAFTVFWGTVFPVLSDRAGLPDGCRSSDRVASRELLQPPP
jgi:cytochrome c-type biogenesis protein CcmF